MPFEESDGSLGMLVPLLAEVLARGGLIQRYHSVRATTICRSIVFGRQPE